MARGLAAILAADVVGYSRLMAVDEARTHERLRALRQDFIEPKIAEHHGRVARLMGDGALVRRRLVCAPPFHRMPRTLSLPQRGMIMFTPSSSPTRRDLLVLSAAAGAASLLPASAGAATGGDAIRPFSINVPEEALVDLRRRIAATRWPERRRSQISRRACSSRRFGNSRAIGRQITIGASARRN